MGKDYITWKDVLFARHIYKRHWWVYATYMLMTVANTYLGNWAAVANIAVIVTIIHMALFFIDAYETERRRRIIQEHLNRELWKRVEDIFGIREN